LKITSSWYFGYLNEKENTGQDYPRTVPEFYTVLVLGISIAGIVSDMWK